MNHTAYDEASQALADNVAELLADHKSLPTEDDLPYEDGVPMESDRHRDQMFLLIELLRQHWSARTDYYVSGNMFIHYDPESRKLTRGPDFFLVLNAEQRKRKSWVVWQENMRYPDVIIELLSDSTREIDKGLKKELYCQVFQTPEYYLYDPLNQEFIAYHLQDQHYHEASINAEGKVYSAVMDLYLGIYEQQLRFFTSKGDLILSAWEMAQQEKLRAEQAEQLLAEYRRRFGDLNKD